ncbi:ATP-dependent helicase [Lactiplantibacillus plantarum]|nr:ATP-dependent helicase [Lactiplantibacillus plantarum]
MTVVGLAIAGTAPRLAAIVAVNSVRTGLEISMVDSPNPIIVTSVAYDDCAGRQEGSNVMALALIATVNRRSLDTNQYSKALSPAKELSIIRNLSKRLLSPLNGKLTR